jgi:uncharacterized protein YeaO (DUF488 family)
MEELSSPEKTRLIEDIARHAKHHDITLVYGAKDTEHANIKVLEEVIHKNAAAAKV